MERYVVSRELAEKLKEAGYKQKGEFMWYNNWMHGDRWEVVSMRGIALRDKECIAPMTDELLEQLPTTIVLPNSKGRAYLEAQWSDDRTCRYDYRDGYGSVLDNLVDFPDHPHNWYKKNADALARLWIWCKENGYLDEGQGGQESE